MKYVFNWRTIVAYFVIISAFLLIPMAGNRAVATLTQENNTSEWVVIDAGHGGVDGGAVSCTGVYESHLNLEIALKLRDMMHLIGIQTSMIRDTDISVYTEGNTIASKKVSDIRERVRIVNTTPNALLISIHQNMFSDPKYYGSQVFHNGQSDSILLAERLQTSFREQLNPSNKRQCKKAKGIYLMEHINCGGILIECGFLSNPLEEKNLRDEEYQKKLCAVIAATVSQYLNT